VFVTGLSLGHRDYPLKGKDAELKPDVRIEIDSHKRISLKINLAKSRY
jgi:hypothetical protein